ncbi:MAG: efflux RND transporter permease subunit, partial [Phycisphaerae bacterium]
REIAANVEMPEGYFVDYGGQFENLIRASKRLTIIIPIALAIVLFLLWMSSGSWLDAAIVFTGAPMAAFGGIIALWLRDMPFTVSAAVGFIAVSGVSVLNGLVLMSTIRQREAEGLAPADAIESARLERMRPILMTALVAAIGFVPMALNTGVGAEVQRPLATVVIGGVISDSVLTLLVLPALVILTSRARKAALPDSTFEIPSSSEDVLRGPAANVSTDGA